MKSNLRSFIGVLAIGATVFFLIQWWQDWRLNRSLNALNEIVQSEDLSDLLSPDSEGETADQAMRGVHMVQGKEGHEVWQLRAEWGTYHEESGLVEMQFPDALYAMGSTNEDGQIRPNDGPVEYLSARSRTGKAEEGGLVIMDGDFYAEYQEQTVEGPYATFLTEERVLELPRGGEFSGREVWGEGNKLWWDMATNVMEAEGNVTVIWTPSSEEVTQ